MRTKDVMLSNAAEMSVERRKQSIGDCYDMQLLLEVLIDIRDTLDYRVSLIYNLLNEYVIKH